MSKPKWCQHDDCDVQFGLFHWRHKCIGCRRIFCSKHCREYRDQALAEGIGEGEGFCRECGPNFTAAVQKSKHVETWSSNYRGKVSFDRKRSVKEVSSGWNRDRDDSDQQLRVAAAYAGFDLVHDVRVTRDTASESSDSGKGTHYYTVWRMRGIAAYRETREK